MAEEGILVEYRGRVAIITLNVPKKLNALGGEHYYKLSVAMLEVAQHDEVFITVLTGNGRFFSAGADVTFGSQVSKDAYDERHLWLRSFAANNLQITHAFYTHPKILVTALNGPAVGLSAALIAHSDFIYAAPHAYILTPFSSLGLVTEGNASLSFVKRLGISKANEALIMSKKISIEDLVSTGFVNKIIDVGEKGSPKFLEEVLKEVDERLGEHLNGESLLKIKALIKKPDLAIQERQGVDEVFGGMERFLRGIPQKEFARLASGEKKHKL